MAKEFPVRTTKRKTTRDLAVRHVVQAAGAPIDLSQVEQVIADAIYAEFRVWERRTSVPGSVAHQGGQ